MTPHDAKIATFGGLTVDRIVRSGHAVDDVAGGNALYTALGAWLYGASVELISFAGNDYPEAVLERLEAAGIDVSSVRRSSAPSIRLWILYDDDGQRQIHYRAVSSDLAVLEDTFPDVVAQQTQRQTWGGAHIGALPVRMQRPLVEQLSGLGIRLTLDSIEADGDVGGDLSAYLDDPMLSHVTTFLPSEAEMAEICAPRSMEETVSQMTSIGLPQLVVKRGAAGVHVYDLNAGVGARVSAAKADQIVDPTGAGDVFCGAFLAASVQGMSPIEAATAGAAAASFVVEGIGAMHLLEVDTEDLTRRERTVRTSPISVESR